MKKSKPKSRAAAPDKKRSPAKSSSKSKTRSVMPSKPRASAALTSAGFEPLEEAISALAAIAAELRQITDDLRDTMRPGQDVSADSREADIDAVVVTEVEGSEDFDEDS